MAQVDDYLRKQAAELLQALNEGCYKEDNIPCQIEESLFLGSFGAANNEEELNRLNITHILTVGSAMPPAYPNDFVYKVLKVSDGPSTNIKQHFDECFDYIEEAERSGGSVLVHCFVGRSRSVAVVVPYLLKKHGMTLFEALDHVKSGRARAAPNSTIKFSMLPLLELLNVSIEFVLSKLQLDLCPCGRLEHVTLLYAGL